MEVLVRWNGEPRYRLRVAQGHVLLRARHVRQKLAQLEGAAPGISPAEIRLQHAGRPLEDAAAIARLGGDRVTLDMVVVPRPRNTPGEALQRQILQRGAAETAQAEAYVRRKRAKYLRESGREGDPWAAERALLHAESPRPVFQAHGDAVLLGGARRQQATQTGECAAEDSRSDSDPVCPAPGGPAPYARAAREIYAAALSRVRAAPLDVSLEVVELDIGADGPP